jgi:putative methyltransferase (TIGR04325 family)
MSSFTPSTEIQEIARQTEDGKSIWVGVFDSWTEALVEADRHNQKRNAIETGFSSERWLNRQKAMLKDARRGKWERYSTLPIVAAISSPTMIVDFGGGSGWTYWALQDHTREALSKYVIIEISTLIDEFENSFSQDEVEYSTLSDFNGYLVHEDSLFYANSSLQYVQNDELIRSIAREKNPRHILIDDMQVASQDFYSHQRYYGQRIPCRFSALQGAKELLTSEGYRLDGYWPYPKSYSGHLKPKLEFEGVSVGTADIEICIPMTALYTRIST